jgi:hypothetical protein
LTGAKAPRDKSGSARRTLRKAQAAHRQAVIMPASIEEASQKVAKKAQDQ